MLPRDAAVAASEQEHWPERPLRGSRHVISQKAKPHPRMRLLGLCVKILEITRCSGALQPGTGEKKKAQLHPTQPVRSKGVPDAEFFLILHSSCLILSWVDHKVLYFPSFF